MTTTGRITTGRTPGAIDRALGLRIRQRRIMLGITQQQLAELIGVTFQQAHKYEKGLNRLSVARLFTVAEALGTSVTELLADLEPAGQLPSPTRTQQRNLKLASAFASLTSHEQTAVLSMVRLMARKDAA